VQFYADLKHLDLDGVLPVEAVVADESSTHCLKLWSLYWWCCP